MKAGWKELAGKADRHNLILLCGIAVVGAVMTLAKPELFPTWTNLNSMLLQISEIGLLCVGMMLAFLIGGIDLSVVSNAVLSATAAGCVMRALAPGGSIAAVTAGIAVGLALATLCGVLNGLLIARLRLPAILATLATNSLYRGIATGFTGGSTLGGLPEEFAAIGSGTLLGVYYAFLIFLAVAAAMGCFLGKTKEGIRAALMGSNPRASYFSGVNNTRLTIRVHGVIGLIAGVAGIIMMSRANSINPDYGVSYLLQTILICVVAGVNISGGSAKMSGLVLALVLMQMISTSFNMLLVGYSGATFFKNVVWGLLLIALMVVKYYGEHPRRRAVMGKGGGYA